MLLCLIHQPHLPFPSQPYGYYPPEGYPPIPHPSTTPTSDVSNSAQWISIQQQILRLQQQQLQFQPPVPSFHMNPMAPPPMVPPTFAQMPANLSQASTPTVPLATQTIPVHGPPMPTSAPPVARPPVAPVAPPSGITPIPVEPSVPPPVNSEIPVGLKYDANFPLYVINQPGEFEQWISALVSHLRTSQLTHLLPNEFGTLSQPLTNGETLGLNWISANYLKKSAHPQWMIESLKSGVPPAQTIIEALGLHMRQHDADAMLEKLRLLKYSGDIRAFAYVAQVKQIIEPLLGVSNPALESIIKKTILRNLTGPYKTLADRFRTRLSSYPIQEIFDRLLAQYAATETQSTSSASKHSSQRAQKRKRTCTNCNLSNHTADRCPKLTPSTSKSTSTSTSSYRPRNSAHKPSNRNESVQHANNVNSVVPDLNEEIARHLRRAPLPSPTNKFFMIDTGCHTSIVNDENFLHNKRSPDNV